MNAYSVTPSGNVVDATKLVEKKLRELAQAQEDLIIARIFEARFATQQDKQEAAEAAPVVKPRKKRALGGHRVTPVRQQLLWKLWNNPSVQSQFSDRCFDVTKPTFEDIGLFVKDVSIFYTFEWCKNLSNASVLTIWNFFKSQMA